MSETLIAFISLTGFVAYITAVICATIFVVKKVFKILEKMDKE